MSQSGGNGSEPTRTGNLARVVVWILLALGVALRLRVYLFNRSLWLDEAMLALNIMARPFGRLMEPLEFNQAAPLGFLFAERTAVNLFGGSEYALRFFPLVCGIASLFLFWRVVGRFLSPRAAAVALGLFVLADRLVYYSSETKPYSTDVAVGLLVWWVVARGDAPSAAPARAWGWVSAVVGAAAIWFSYPVVFLLGGVGLHWAWRQTKARQWRALAVVAATGAIWAASFAAAYAVSLRGVTQNTQLADFWGEAAAPLLPRSYEDCLWWIKALGRIAALPLGREVEEIVALAAILGGVVVYRTRPDWFSRIVIPGGLALIASGLHMYPLADRLWLFMIPGLLILVAAGLDTLWSRAGSAWPLVGVVFGFLLLAHPTLYAAYHLVRPQQVEETRPLLQYLARERRAGDVLHLYYESGPAARYYAERGVIQLDDAVLGVFVRNDLGRYLRSFDTLRGAGRVWMLFSHVNVERGLNEEELAVLALDALGKRVLVRRTTGAALYLYDTGG